MKIDSEQPLRHECAYQKDHDREAIFLDGKMDDRFFLLRKWQSHAK
jgi:hypothetical protein